MPAPAVFPIFPVAARPASLSRAADLVQQLGVTVEDDEEFHE
jgi:hypothetical protein